MANSMTQSFANPSLLIATYKAVATAAGANDQLALYSYNAGPGKPVLDKATHEGAEVINNIGKNYSTIIFG